jgi:dTDP-4-amino-4,6-dideoxygalactose transaminase
MEKFDQPIFVTKPFLPPFEEFCKNLLEIWENQWLTNNGPVLKRYREELKKYFATNNICLFANGTLALQIALQGMGISGEVITTPFTFVATTHALYWNKIRPVFCDIEPDTFTLDPDKIEALITPWTTAILAVHVFGRPCKLDALADIARRHKLTLIYDAAHAFGVQIDGKSIGQYGDISMFSFHATKLYHSIEGGMLIFKDYKLNQIFSYLKNFGFKSETEVVMPGTNAKMNEIQALMGSVLLKYIQEIIKKKKKIYNIYKDRLSDIPGLSFSPDPTENVEHNYAYVPILIEKAAFGMSRDELYERLKQYNIFARRYFYPILTELACYQNLAVSMNLAVSKFVAEQVLTLPTYVDLSEYEVCKICDIIQEIRINKFCRNR